METTELPVISCAGKNYRKHSLEFKRHIVTVQFSDYPEAVKKIPRIGSYARLDMEAIVALKPDLEIGY